MAFDPTQRYDVVLVVERLTWDQYQAVGDFAVYDPENPAAADDGQVYVNLATWQIDSQEHMDGGLVSVVMVHMPEVQDGQTEETSQGEA